MTIPSHRRLLKEFERIAALPDAVLHSHGELTIEFVHNAARDAGLPEPAASGPSSLSKIRAPLFTARALNATGQSRITLSLRQKKLRAACGPRQEERGLKCAQNHPRRRSRSRLLGGARVDGHCCRQSECGCIPAA